jgi:hypothetical protein
MRRSAKELLGYALSARDGEIGKLHDLLFNDAAWGVRHVVVDIGSWLSDKLVLVPPSVFQEPYREEKTVSVDMTCEQIQSAPRVAADPPVSRRLGELWPRVSAVKMAAGLGVVHPDLMEKVDRRPRDPHLRSTREVMGYEIQAIDGLIGHVEDFIVDTETWIIRYVVVDTRNWWAGKKVLVAPDWMSEVDWPGRTVHVELTRNRIKGSPAYDPSQPVNLEYEDRVYDYYGRFKYWVAR